MSARILDLTLDAYYADPMIEIQQALELPSAVPSLSQSICHEVVARSPLHGYTLHPQLGGLRGKRTKARDEGTLLHSLILGKGADIVPLDFDDFRTKRAQELRDAALLEGKQPVLKHKLAAMIETAAHLHDNCAKYGFAFSGQSEVPIAWTEPGVKNAPVVCRGLIDHLQIGDDVAAIFEVKKAANANPLQLARLIVQYGYDIQQAAYTHAISALHPELTGKIDFVFLFMEIEPPYAVTPARLDGALQEIGERRWARGVEIWERCLARNEWPPYCSEPVTLIAPTWVITQELGSEWL